MIANRLIAALLPLMLLGCEPASQSEEITLETTSAGDETVNSSSADLEQLFEEYFQSTLVLNPTFATYIGDNRYNDQYVNNIGPAWREAYRSLQQEFLERINAVDSSALKGQELLS